MRPGVRREDGNLGLRELTPGPLSGDGRGSLCRGLLTGPPAPEGGSGAPMLPTTPDPQVGQATADQDSLQEGVPGLSNSMGAAV